MSELTRALLVFLLAALPAAAQSFTDRPALGGSSVFSEGLDPAGNPARFDRATRGVYLGGDLGDLKPRGEAQALEDLVGAGGDPARLAPALQALEDRPWALRERAYGLAWAGAGGLRFGYSREDLRGSFATVDPASLTATLDARQAVVDRLYAGAGSLAGTTAFGFKVRLERVRFGQATFATAPGPGQRLLADPQAPLDGVDRTGSVTSATLDLGLVQDLGRRARFGLTLDRLAGRWFGDLHEQPLGRAGLQVDLGPSLQLAVESDLNAVERLPLPVKRRVASASLRLALSGRSFLTVGGERRRYADGPASTILGAALHLQLSPLQVALGFRFDDDRPFAAAALRLPGAP
ncbi:MAG TPA: hypothetical protein VFT46_12520 [Holophagaceae bacterium]|nr:hypothetical protein [Holophagaceae bacterium]